MDEATAPMARPKGPLFATIASVVLAPTIWLTSFCAGFLVDVFAGVHVLFAIVGLGYALGFALAVWGLLGIPRTGTGAVLGLGLLGGVMNAFFLTASVAAFLLYYGTYG